MHCSVNVLIAFCLKLIYFLKIKKLKKWPNDQNDEDVEAEQHLSLQICNL